MEKGTKRKKEREIDLLVIDVRKKMSRKYVEKLAQKLLFYKKVSKKYFIFPAQKSGGGIRNKRMGISNDSCLNGHLRDICSRYKLNPGKEKGGEM